MVDPSKMCNRHLLGEHVEIHMILGSINKRRNLGGFLEKGLIQPTLIKERHDALTREMISRGYKHKTPINKNPDISYLGSLAFTEVDRKASYSNLLDRCPRCRDISKK